MTIARKNDRRIESVCKTEYQYQEKYIYSNKKTNSIGARRVRSGRDVFDEQFDFGVGVRLLKEVFQFGSRKAGLRRAFRQPILDHVERTVPHLQAEFPPPEPVSLELGSRKPRRDIFD
jgi:hypothetical protein